MEYIRKDCIISTTAKSFIFFWLPRSGLHSSMLSSTKKGRQFWVLVSILKQFMKDPIPKKRLTFSRNGSFTSMTHVTTCLTNSDQISQADPGCNVPSVQPKSCTKRLFFCTRLPKKTSREGVFHLPILL